MNARTCLTAAALGLVATVATSARADIALKDAGELVGSWKLESVAMALDKPRIEENRTWEFFADGRIVTSGYNRHFKTQDRHEWSYQIVNGKIMVADPGRPGKTIDYSVYEKKDNELILKGGIEGFYFFKKQ